ncbi:hypothetical protein AGMMS49992_30220 [Clostridia bacterium]|nr:hypothetical protein AGMMS49992_30220 [Clostridia bacterium]
MAKGRRAYPVIEYDGMDISDEVSSGLLSITYTDNIDKADDISITVEDREGNWIGSWFPQVASKKG